MVEMFAGVTFSTWFSKSPDEVILTTKSINQYSKLSINIWRTNQGVVLIIIPYWVTAHCFMDQNIGYLKKFENIIPPKNYSLMVIIKLYLAFWTLRKGKIYWCTCSVLIPHQNFNALLCLLGHHKYVLIQAEIHNWFK